MKRELTILTVFVAAAFAVLVSLGVWQLERLAWKEGLIAKIEARTQAEPVSLDAALKQWKNTGEVEYLRVRLSGSFLHQYERHLFSVLKGKSGWHVVTPLETPKDRIVMVDRGFVPMDLKFAEARISGNVDGERAYTGLARAPGTKDYFTPDNDVKANAWYWRDLESMAAFESDRDDGKTLTPFFIELEESEVPGGWPKGGVTRVELPNKHLQYAGTWFGLAGGLLAVFGVFVFGRIRRRAFT